MIGCVIYLALVVLYPLKETYLSLKNKEQQKSLMWGIYWGFFTLIWTLLWMMPFLAWGPIEFVLLLAQVWLYHSEYRGALFLAKTVNKCEVFATVKAMIAQYAGFLKIFEADAKSEVKTEAVPESQLKPKAE